MPFCIICGIIGLFKSIFNIGIIHEYIQRYRNSICQSCIYFIFKSKRCKICGCFLKHKIRLVSSFCPKEKW